MFRLAESRTILVKKSKQFTQTIPATCTGAVWMAFCFLLACFRFVCYSMFPKHCIHTEGLLR
jgi:hypothetical protein